MPNFSFFDFSSKHRLLYLLTLYLGNVKNRNNFTPNSELRTTLSKGTVLAPNLSCILVHSEKNVTQTLKVANFKGPNPLVEPINWYEAAQHSNIVTQHNSSHIVQDSLQRTVSAQQSSNDLSGEVSSRAKRWLAMTTVLNGWSKVFWWKFCPF